MSSAAPLAVVFLSHAFPREASDPVGSFVLRLAVALREQEVQATVVAPAGPGLARQDEFEGVCVRRFRYAPRALETLAYTGTMLSQVQRSWSARGALAGLLAGMTRAGVRETRRTGARLVHAHWWYPGGLAGSAVARLRGIPCVTTLHGSDIRAARGSALAARVFRHVMRHSTAVTTVSHWLASETEALAPGTGALVAPMPVLPGLFHPGTVRERDRLLFVGKLNQQKGIDALLVALSRMRVRPRLDIVVGVGSDSGPARARAAELGVADQIAWHPLLPQAELAALYRAATILVAPMTGEGLGLVAIEAAMSALPVVAFASGGLTDIVVDGSTGVLVPPGDVDALARALDDLLSRSDQGASLGERARDHALATFAPTAVAQRYADLYRSLVRGRATA